MDNKELGHRPNEGRMCVRMQVLPQSRMEISSQEKGSPERRPNTSALRQVNKDGIKPCLGLETVARREQCTDWVWQRAQF